MSTNKDKKDKDKKDGATPPAGAAQAPARTRSALSMDKKLAVAISAIVAFVTANAKLTADAILASEPVQNAIKLAAEVNDKVFKKIDDRLAALNLEIAEAAKPENLARAASAQVGEPGKDGFVAAQKSGVDTLKALTQEMSRLQNKRKTIEASAQKS